jgi:hypothetical protein
MRLEVPSDSPPGGSPISPAEESSRLTRANTEKDLGGIPRTRSRGLTEEEVLAASQADSPERDRVVPEWSGEGESPAMQSWLWPLQFCCAVAMAGDQQNHK